MSSPQQQDEPKSTSPTHDQTREAEDKTNDSTTPEESITETTATTITATQSEEEPLPKRRRTSSESNDNDSEESEHENEEERREQQQQQQQKDKLLGLTLDQLITSGQNRNNNSNSSSSSSNNNRNKSMSHESSEEFAKLKKEALEDEFYLRYYVGHKRHYGHEYLQFEFYPNGLLKYTNNSQYRKDGLIKKEVYVSNSILQELRKMISDSDILRCDDELWPEPDHTGTLELEIVMNNEHVSFATRKIGTSSEIAKSDDPDGLMNFYFLTQDLKAFVFALVRLHFKIKPL